MITWARAFLDKISRRCGWGYSFSSPRSMFLEHTTRCNLRCKTCARWYWGGEFRDMPNDLSDKVIRQILPRVDHITLSGYGEPLMNRGFADLLDKAVALGKTVGLITNSLLLDDSMMEKLYRNTCQVSISIDGGTNEAMRHVRGVDLDRVLAKVARFDELLLANPDNGFRLTIICVLLRSNIEDIPDLIEKLSAYKVVGRLIVQNFTVGKRDDEFAFEAIHHHKDLARRMLPLIREAAQKSPIIVELPTYSWMGCGEKSKSGGDKGKFRAKCYTPWFDLYVDVNGSIRSCCYGGAESLGSLQTHSFRRIWNGRAFRKLRRKVNSGCPPIYCQGCPVRMGINAGEEPWEEPRG